MTNPIEFTLAVFLIVLGASYLLQYKHWIRFIREAIERPWRLFPTALVMLASGICSGSTYDDWSSTWPVFITVMAWLMALEGAIMLLFPGFLKRMERVSDNFFALYFRAGGILLIILGASLYGHFFGFR
jgi:uncharacterized protein YjeT (DUF2065 family)